MIVHLNGSLIESRLATVSVFDRGFLFGDGLYEGLRAFGGRVVGMDRHVERLRAGLAEARIDWDAARLKDLTDELLAANGLRDAFIYWQVTRGTPPPGSPWRARVPAHGSIPTILGFCYATPTVDSHQAPAPRRVITVRDTRWLRGTMKSISLLGSVLAAIEAAEAGTDDAILIRDGVVAEGTSSNVFVALRDASGRPRLATPSIQSAPILAGVTRDILIDRVPSCEVRTITADELAAADEVMLVGTLTMVASVVEIDRVPVGDGAPGPAASMLLGVLREVIGSEQSATPLAGVLGRVSG
ncbi:MAG: aminotransferase class IV [Phycisphaeraceae bacterium]|nr:aminotransferase class IV [Phycisphaerae bacterium]MBX3392456.1 aminotransferase class IV [Phycisphaeraceae bacterium]